MINECEEWIRLVNDLKGRLREAEAKVEQLVGVVKRLTQVLKEEK